MTAAAADRVAAAVVGAVPAAEVAAGARERHRRGWEAGPRARVAGCAVGGAARSCRPATRRGGSAARPARARQVRQPVPRAPETARVRDCWRAAGGPARRAAALRQEEVAEGAVGAAEEEAAAEVPRLRAAARRDVAAARRAP